MEHILGQNRSNSDNRADMLDSDQENLDNELDCDAIVQDSDIETPATLKTGQNSARVSHRLDNESARHRPV